MREPEAAGHVGHRRALLREIGGREQAERPIEAVARHDSGTETEAGLERVIDIRARHRHARRGDRVRAQHEARRSSIDDRESTRGPSCRAAAPARRPLSLRHRSQRECAERERQSAQRALVICRFIESSPKVG